MSREELMSLATVGLIVAGWIALQKWVLPALGVPT
jgi:hypothetical protein